MTLPGSLLEKIAHIPPSDCWIWVGAVANSHSGVPVIKIAKRIYPVRLLVYEREVGDLLEGERVIATCGQVRCVKPEHLRTMSPYEFGLAGRITSHKRAVEKTHFACGHENTPENRRVRTDGNGSHSCRACKREFNRKWKRTATRQDRYRKTGSSAGRPRSEEMQPGEALLLNHDRNYGTPEWLKEWRKRRR